MINMEYCAAQNTKLAMEQLIDLINNGELNKSECSRDEWDAMLNLAQVAEDLHEALEGWESDNYTEF